MKFKIIISAIKDYLFITFGSTFMALGISVFLIDARVVPGGVSGLAMAIHYLSGNTLPVGLLIWLFNIPLFIWGIRELGPRFGARTFFGFTTNAFFIDFFRGEVPGFKYVALQNSEAIQHLLENDFLFLILIN